MVDRDTLAARFEAHRQHLLAVAAKLLGSVAEAEDAVQETWLRLARTGDGEIDNLGGWLTTVVSRICLDHLRTRSARGEAPVESGMPEPGDDDPNPEDIAILTESTAEALAVVLDTLTPIERVAFVLHDVFAVPFDEIAPIVDRSPTSARQLASRARRRVRSPAPAADADRSTRQAVVDAFLAAARHGDFHALLAGLDPNVVLRVDGGAVPGVSREVHGAEGVSRQAAGYTQLDIVVQPALIDGEIGAIAFRNGQMFSLTKFAIREQRIAEITILADPERLRRLPLGTVEA